MSILFGEPTAWGDDGPTLFDFAMAIALDNIAKLDDRRRDRFADRLRQWANVNPAPGSARMANAETNPGDRFVAALTAVARRAVHKHARDADDEQSLFCEGVLMGLQRLVKYWGPGHRYPQRCPVRYTLGAVKSGCSNAVRKHRRSRGQSDG